jgi:uncharacterized protein YukE
MVIDVDLNGLRVFEQNLSDLRQTMTRQRAAFQAETDAIKRVWNDETYKSYRRSFDEMMAEIEGFERACDKHCDYLRRKYAAGIKVLRG